MLDRLSHAIVPLWPVITVWLFMVLPYLAYSAPVLRREMGLPWWFRGLLWLLERTWPYTKAAKFGRVLDAWPWRSSFPLRPSYREEQLELPLTFDHDEESQGSSEL